MEGTCLNTVKATDSKPTVNIIFNGKKLKAFPLRSKTRQRCSILSLLFKILARVIRQEKENIQIRNEEVLNKTVKQSHFPDDCICVCVYIHTYIYIYKIYQKLLQLVNKYSTGYKINIQKSFTFLYSNNKQHEKRNRIIPLTKHQT